MTDGPTSICTTTVLCNLVQFKKLYPKIRLAKPNLQVKDSN